MYDVRYMDIAYEDLSIIGQYLEREADIEASDKIVDYITESISSLDEMPYRHPVYHADPDFRKMILPKTRYYVFYTVDEKKQLVRIHRILHESRNIEREMLYYKAIYEK
ncbi:MAG: type II toxin-antitoxin system RelE/ParE family toxin [Defluviitaleaceae bacterium]|nr:type II toxin-antitoxin system RelE/ParE family toxin [Defluviitaleaceae bacterium]